MKIIANRDLAYRVRLLIGLLLALFAIPMWFMTESGMETFWYIVPLVIAMQIYLIFRFSNVQLMIITTLYIFIYFAYLIPYFYNGVQLSEHTEYKNFTYFSTVLYLFYLFYTGLTLAAVKGFNPQKLKLIDIIKIPTQSWITVLYIIFIFAALALVFRQGASIFDAESPYLAYKENLENVNSLPLMFILFMLFVYFIVKSKFIRNTIMGILFLGLLYFTVTRGFRMIIAPLGIMIFGLYFENRFKTRTLMLGLVVGYMALILVNSMKMGGEIDVNDLFSENDEFILSHHADNLYGSAAGIGLLDKDKITFSERVMLNVGFLSEAILPPTILPDKMKYPHIIGVNAATGGGGLFVTGSYFMWGYGGVMIFGFLLGWLVRQTYDRRKVTWALVCLVVMAFAPRWVSYDFHVILRYPVLALIIYSLLRYVVISKKNISSQ